MQKTLTIALFLLLAACSKQEEQTQSDVYYTCSMDPQVMETKPGNCPICKMPLTPVKKNKSKHETGLHLSDQQVQLGHIIAEPIAEHVLGDEILLTGVLTTNENNSGSLSSRVMGRIEKLYFKNVGDKINKGDPVYEIYSEELNLDARELKLAVNKKKKLKSNIIDIDKIIISAKKKLSLYGLSDKQIENIENEESDSYLFTIFSSESGIITSIDLKEGEYAMEGSSVFHITDYSSLWAEIQVFIDDLPKIKENMQATVYFPGIEGLKRSCKISFVNPELNTASQINYVRIEIPNSDNRLKVGMQVNVSVLLNQINSLALPTDAILLDSKGASVWIKTEHNHYKNVMVSTGIATNEFTQITEGLKKGDSIVTSGAYLLNSEYQFKKGTNPMEGHDMSKMKMQESH